MQRRSEKVLKLVVLLGSLAFVTGCGGTASSTENTATTFPAPTQATTPSVAAVAPTSSQSLTSSPTPSSGEQASAEEGTVRYLKPGEIAIPAGLSDDDLVAAYIERSNAWIMAATSPEISERFIANAAGADFQYESGLVHGAYVSELVANAKNPSAWNPDVQSFILKRMERVEEVARKYVQSVPEARAQPKQRETYKQWFHLIKVDSASSKGPIRTITVVYQLKSNSEKSFGQPALRHYPSRAHITFDESSGHALMTDVVIQQLP